MASIRAIALVLLTAAVAAAAAGCGSGVAGTRSAGSAAPHASPNPPASSLNPPASSPNPPGFAWLRPAPAPAGWSLAHVTGTAVLAYPASWHRIHSDPGTISAARFDPASGLVTEYLNVTPQQGEETLANWATFRPGHNREEGDSRIRVLASARGLHFRDGSGSCVVDRYRTPATTYQEIACLVGGPRGANVIVAAGLAARWAQDGPALERAVSAFLA